MYELIESDQSLSLPPAIHHKPLLLFVVKVLSTPPVFAHVLCHCKGLQFQYVRESLQKALDKTASYSYFYWESSQGCLQKA